MMPDYLAEALLQYGMPDAQAELIRHNENMTFRVDGRYLLRIHQHAEGFFTASLYEGLNRAEIYRRELEFLTFLSANGMPVQKPCTDREGRFVTLLSDGTAATLLTWLPGRIPEKDAVDSELCFQMGELTGRLHKLACLSPKIPVLKYDSDLCCRLKRKLEQRKEEGAWDAACARNMGDALDYIAEKLREAENDMILTHSDLSLSNILITDNGLVPIDFSLFGYCHPMMDLSSLFCSLSGLESRRAAAAGYVSAGGNICMGMIDCCFALNILLGILMHCGRWPGEEWFPARLKRWCREVFEPLAGGEALFSDDFYLLHVK